MQEDNLLTRATPASLIKSMQFFIGLAMGLVTLWYSSSQWERHSLETLMEVKELRKDYQRIEKDVRSDYRKIETTLSRVADMVNKHEVKLEMLELKIKMLDGCHDKSRKK